MSTITSFLCDYGSTIVYALLTAIAGFIGIQCTKCVEKLSNEKEKARVVEYAIKAVEQVYSDLHGEEKKNKAIEYIAEMLNNKGIAITDLEISVMVEAAVCEFNKQLNKTK